MGDLIIEGVYYDSVDPELLKQGFGMYVTKDNVDELMTILNDQAINFDLPVNTYQATFNKKPEE